MKKPAKLPDKMRHIFWSTDINSLDLVKNKSYIIHQILIYGALEDLKWLLKTYSKNVVTDVFKSRPSKNYPAEVYYFIKNYILDLKNEELDANNYVTSISGKIRPRAAKYI